MWEEIEADLKDAMGLVRRMRAEADKGVMVGHRTGKDRGAAEMSRFLYRHGVGDADGPGDGTLITALLIVAAIRRGQAQT